LKPIVDDCVWKRLKIDLPCIFKAKHCDESRVCLAIVNASNR
jgi:hypothetical protein